MALETGFGVHFDAEYESLPEPIKMLYTPKDYAWMQPEQRARLVEAECLPEVAED